MARRSGNPMIEWIICRSSALHAATRMRGEVYLPLHERR